jgi:hypothetical protein
VHHQCRGLEAAAQQLGHLLGQGDLQQRFGPPAAQFFQALAPQFIQRKS